MTTLILDRMAQREADRATSYFRHKGILPVGRFLDALDAVLERVRNFPMIGIPYRGVYRCMKMKRYKYLVFYQVVSESLVRVYAIAHSSRKPRLLAATNSQKVSLFHRPM